MAVEVEREAVGAEPQHDVAGLELPRPRARSRRPPRPRPPRRAPRLRARAGPQPRAGAAVARRDRDGVEAEATPRRAPGQGPDPARRAGTRGARDRASSRPAMNPPAAIAVASSRTCAPRLVGEPLRAGPQAAPRDETTARSAGGSASPRHVARRLVAQGRLEERGTRHRHPAAHESMREGAAAGREARRGGGNRERRGPRGRPRPRYRRRRCRPRIGARQSDCRWRPTATPPSIAGRCEGRASRSAAA